jgi:hypothetical protein
MYGLRPLWCTKAHRRGAIERGEHGELGSGLTGARARCGDLAMVGEMAEEGDLGDSGTRATGEEEECSGRCGESWGSHRPFIGVGGAPERGGGGGGVTVALMALTPLKTGARLRGGLSEGNDGGASNGSGGIQGWNWVARGGRRR